MMFYERQKFTQWWIWLILIVISAFIFRPIYDSIISQEALTGGQWFGLIVVALVLLLFAVTKLETWIDDKGITIVFIPFLFKKQFYPWDEIESVQVRKYSPLLEYGGWGWRIGPNGKAFNINGNQGLQILFKNRKALLIGTQKPEELEKVLKNLNK